MEQTRELEFAQEDPAAFLKRFPDGAVFDEIQRVPQLLSELQVIVDERQRMGQFVISGSQQFSLLASISQSLAGRTSILRLLPLSIAELKQASLLRHPDSDACMVSGFYPGKWGRKIGAEDFFGAYQESYIERDIRQLLHIKNLSLFRKFTSICAGRVSGLLNKDSLARDIGISPTTVEQWLSMLETSFVTFRLQPWHRNQGKRLVKSPKLYFYDVGLACYLLGIYEPKQLETHPLRGALFENMIVAEAMKSLSNLGLKRDLFFYRDSNGQEIDLIVDLAGTLLPIEIKASERFSAHFIKALNSVRLSDTDAKTWLVLGGDESYERLGVDVVAWDEFGANLTSALS